MFAFFAVCSCINQFKNLQQLHLTWLVPEHDYVRFQTLKFTNFEGRISIENANKKTKIESLILSDAFEIQKVCTSWGLENITPWKVSEITRGVRPKIVPKWVVTLTQMSTVSNPNSQGEHPNSQGKFPRRWFSPWFLAHKKCLKMLSWTGSRSNVFGANWSLWGDLSWLGSLLHSL